jgi:hypothetical protein
VAEGERAKVALLAIVRRGHGVESRALFSQVAEHLIHSESARYSYFTLKNIPHQLQLPNYPAFKATCPNSSTEPTFLLRHRHTTARWRTPTVDTTAPKPTPQTCLILDMLTPATMIRMDNLKMGSSDGSAALATGITATLFMRVAHTVKTIGGPLAARLTKANEDR